MRRGLLFALGATAFWSMTGLFIDPLVTRYGLTPVQVSLWRALLVAPSLGLIVAWLRPGSLRLSRRELPYYIVYGLVGIAIFNVIWSASVQVNKAAVATALIYSSPVFVTLAARPLFGEAIRPVQGAAIVINVLGCGLVAGIASPAMLLHSPGGLGLGLLSGVAFAAYTLFGKGAARLGSHHPLTVLLYIFAVSAVALLAWGLATEGPAVLNPHLDEAGWLLLIGLSLGPTLCGYACFTASLRTLSAGSASLLTTLEPPITAMLAFVLLGRALRPLQWLGTILIMAGVVVIQLGTWSTGRADVIAAEHDLPELPLLPPGA